MKSIRQPKEEEAMMIEAVLLNRQRNVPVQNAWRDLLKRVVADCVKAATFPHPAEVHVSLVGRRTIRRMNRDFRNLDAVTDVLSFPALSYRDGKPIIKAWDIDPESKRCFLGDIAICMPRMHEQAQEYGHAEIRELAFLAAHGTLHLLGYDHETKEEEHIMFSLQESLLADMGLSRREEAPC